MALALYFPENTRLVPIKSHISDECLGETREFRVGISESVSSRGTGGPDLGFLSPSTIHIWGWLFLCCGLCPVYCGLPSVYPILPQHVNKAACKHHHVSPQWSQHYRHGGPVMRTMSVMLKLALFLMTVLKQSYLKKYRRRNFSGTSRNA